MPATVNTIPLEARMIATRLNEGLSPERIYLFGSHARGNAGPDSDLDFLVVVASSDKSRYERAVEAHTLVRGIAAPNDIIVLTRAEWETQIKAPSSLCSTVLREGILIGDESNPLILRVCGWQKRIPISRPPAF